jgi:hypothetical protein
LFFAAKPLDYGKPISGLQGITARARILVDCGKSGPKAIGYVKIYD